MSSDDSLEAYLCEAAQPNEATQADANWSAAAHRQFARRCSVIDFRLNFFLSPGVQGLEKCSVV